VRLASDSRDSPNPEPGPTSASADESLSSGDEPTAPGHPVAGEDLAGTGRHRSARGLVIVNTGNGKGKTTAALGLLLRAWGRGMRVAMFQFIKSSTGRWGENRAAERLGIPMTPLGDGFTWKSKDLDHDRALARQGWEACAATILAGEHDVVVLDELTYCLKFGWLGQEEVLDVLRRRPPGMHVVITGRDAPPWLIDFADLVTEMTLVKHPYQQGVRGQPGVEF
jgi:cob(I)alamin adenosyltransferase